MKIVFNSLIQFYYIHVMTKYLISFFFHWYICLVSAKTPHVMKLFIMLLNQSLPYLLNSNKNFHQGRHFKFLQDLFLILLQLISLTSHSVDNLFVRQVLNTWFQLSLWASTTYVCPNQPFPFKTHIYILAEHSV